MRTISVLFLFLLLTGGCRFFKTDPYRNTPVSGNVRIAVDETFRPVMEAEIEMFRALYGYAEIKCDYIPEAAAFQNLLEDSVNLIVASRKLKPEEIAMVERRKLYAKQLMVAKDAVALVVHPSNRDSLLSLQQIRDILGGRITDWNQLQPGSPSLPIRVLFDNEKSGIVQFMADSVCKGNFAAPNASALTYNTDVIDYAATHPGVLGFIGTSWISNKNDSLHLSFHKRIKVVSVSENDPATPDNSYKPYQAYLLDNMYPLTRSLYMINTEPRSGLCTGLVSFVASDKGQRIILKSGILPAVAPARIVNVRPDI